MNATEAFLGERAGWAQARVALYDVHGLWGGRNCFVSGGGRVTVQVCPVPHYEERFVLAVPAAEVERLFKLLIETDFITIKLPLRNVRPDEACPTVVLTNAAGEIRRVHKWAGDKHAGFTVVYEALLRLVAAAQAGEPVYQGAYSGVPPGV